MQRRLASLGLAGIAFGLFALLTVLVMRQGRVVSWDLQIQSGILDRYAHPHASQLAFVVIDALSPPVTASVLAVTAAALSVWKRSRVPIAIALAAGAATAALVLGFKYGLARGGPNGGYTPHGGSYPSGHTASLVIFGGTLVLLLARRWWRLLWFAVLVVVAATMAGSLIYANTHWMTDTLGGALLGVGVLAVLDAVLESRPIRRRWPVREVRRAQIDQAQIDQAQIDQAQSAKALEGSATTIESRDGSGPPFSDSFTAAGSAPSSWPGNAP